MIKCRCRCYLHDNIVRQQSTIQGTTQVSTRPSAMSSPLLLWGQAHEPHLFKISNHPRKDTHEALPQYSRLALKTQSPSPSANDSSLGFGNQGYRRLWFGHHLKMEPYLIFVIFFTQANFLENKIYTEKRLNYDKIHRKLSIFCVITAKYTVNCQFFALNL